MGEMADYALEGVMSMGEMRSDFRSGLISHLEAYERGIIDELGYEFPATAPSKQCRYCGEDGLRWIKTDKGWRLGSEGVVHACAQYTH